ncbi:STAS domain-containing protein [Actinomadura rudentiformis]|uniref:STAS domain-containing protein n=1 Tax=Actinomadura rudentiformis TaxID=359158 RepID=A0A6H9YTT6_9ACTN|nr:STAS domain-containing protein [Actinomadura rudentiformis]
MSRSERRAVDDTAGTVPVRIPRRVRRAVLTCSPTPGRVGLIIAGEISLVTRDTLESHLTPLVSRGTDVHLDLSKVVFSDSGGVAVLVSAAQRLPAGKNIHLENPPVSMRRIMDVLYSRVPKIKVQS